jgi:RimJ/RimL family protein N-acetyltransferase
MNYFCRLLLFRVFRGITLLVAMSIFSSVGAFAALERGQPEESQLERSQLEGGQPERSPPGKNSLEQRSRSPRAESQCLDLATAISKKPKDSAKSSGRPITLENQETLKSDRITLSPVTHSDVAFLEQLDSSEGVSEFFGNRNGNPALGSFMIEHSLLPQAKNSHHYFAAWIIRLGSTPVGYIHLRKDYYKFRPSQVESAVQNYFVRHELSEHSLILSVGRVIHPEFRKMGIASEALKLVVDFAKNKLKAAIIFRKGYPDNPYISDTSLSEAGFTKLQIFPPLQLKYYSNPKLDPP